jgi:hypothetical protein
MNPYIVHLLEKPYVENNSTQIIEAEELCVVQTE